MAAVLATSGRWSRIVRALAAVCAAAATTAAAGTPVYYDVAAGAHPHDVAAAPEPGGPVYYTAQRTGRLGIVDPKSRKVEEVDLGPRSSPHGVIVGPDGAPWITDSGQNAIVRVDPKTRAVKRWPLPEGSGYANLNTAAKTPSRLSARVPSKSKMTAFMAIIVPTSHFSPPYRA